jgi:hypothetical protein
MKRRARRRWPLRLAAAIGVLASIFRDLVSVGDLGLLIVARRGGA